VSGSGMVASPLTCPRFSQLLRAKTSGLWRRRPRGSVPGCRGARRNRADRCPCRPHGRCATAAKTRGVGSPDPENGGSARSVRAHRLHGGQPDRVCWEDRPADRSCCGTSQARTLGWSIIHNQVPSGWRRATSAVAPPGMRVEVSASSPFISAGLW